MFHRDCGCADCPRQPGPLRSEASISRRRHFEPEAVRIEEERRVVVGVVLRPRARRVQHLGTGGNRSGVRSIDVGPRFDRERDVMQARRVELELLLLEPLTEADRALAGGREAQVVDLLAALALDEERLVDAEWAEDCGVEGERALEVAADEIDVAEADEHPPSIDRRRPVASSNRGDHARAPAAPQAVQCTVPTRRGASQAAHGATISRPQPSQWLPPPAG